MTKTLLTALALLTLATSCYADSTGTPGERPNSHIDRQQCWRDGGEVTPHTPSNRYFCDVHDDGLIINKLGRIARPDYWMEENHTDFDFEALGAEQYAQLYASTSTSTTTTTEAVATTNNNKYTPDYINGVSRWTPSSNPAIGKGVWIDATDSIDAQRNLPLAEPPTLHIYCAPNRQFGIVFLTTFTLTSSNNEALVSWKFPDGTYNFEYWRTTDDPKTVQPFSDSVFPQQLAAHTTGELAVSFISIDDMDDNDRNAGTYRARFDATGADHHYETISQECQ